MAQINQILCAIDFAEYSPIIADYANTMAQAFNSELHVIYVAPTLTQYVGFQVPPSSIENFVGEIISGAEERMTSFLENNFPSEISTTGHVLTGNAAEEILNFATEKNIDIIVMATHGRKGIDRILFGSVAERIVKYAHIPVLTLRPENGEL